MPNLCDIFPISFSKASVYSQPIAFYNNYLVGGGLLIVLQYLLTFPPPHNNRIFKCQLKKWYPRMKNTFSSLPYMAWDHVNKSIPWEHRCLRKNLKGGVMNTSAHPADLSQATAVSHIGSSRWGQSAPREERMLPQTWVPPSCLLSKDNKVSDLGFSRSVCLEHTAVSISSTISLPTSDAPVKSARFLKGLHLQITPSDKVGSRKRVL